MAHQLGLARTKFSSILTTLRILLFASLFIGIANAAVLDPTGLAQVRGKQSIRTVASVQIFHNNGFAPYPVDPDHLKPTNSAPAVPNLTKGVVSRQVHSSFNCTMATGSSDCNGATDCLYANPDRCNGFIHCDSNGVAWTGYCPLESMVWNDDKKFCDYAQEKGDVVCHKEGTAIAGEKAIRISPSFPLILTFPGLLMGTSNGSRSAASSSRQPLKKTALLGLCVLGTAFVGTI